MGFTGEIELPFLVISEVKEIFQEVATEIVKQGEITDKHEILFLGLISKLIKNIEEEVIPCKAPKLTSSILSNYITCFTHLKY